MRKFFGSSALAVLATVGSLGIAAAMLTPTVATADDVDLENITTGMVHIMTVKEYCSFDYKPGIEKQLLAVDSIISTAYSKNEIQRMLVTALIKVSQQECSDLRVSLDSFFQ